MNTIIEQNELDSELQELHLVTTNWISEEQFLTQEVNFLKKLISQRLKQTMDENPEKAIKLKFNLGKLEENINAVKEAILLHMKRVEDLIVDPTQQFALSIIESHAVLEKKITEDFALIRSCKQDLLSLVG